MVGPVPVLRPMNVGDIVDASIRIYRHTFLPLLGIAAVVQVPLQAVGVCVSKLQSETMFSAQTGARSAEPPWDQLAVVAGAFGGWILLMALLHPLGEAALAIAVSERYLGHPVTIGGAYRAALPYYGRVLWTSFLFGCLVLAAYVGGILALCIGSVVFALWVMVRFLLAADVVVVLENRWGRDALNRSFQLTAGHGWSVFATVFILQLMVAIPAFALSWPLMGVVAVYAREPQMVALLTTVMQAVQATVMVVLHPVIMIGAVLIYYDLRIRKEGFDLMMLAEALGRPIATAAAPVAEQPLFYPPVAGVPGEPPKDPFAGTPGWAAAPGQPEASPAQPAVPAVPLPPPAAEPLLFPTPQPTAADPPAAGSPPPAPDTTPSQEPP